MFRDNHGRIHQRLPHEATFRGIHNASKAKVLIALYLWARELSARDLHRYTGVSAATLATKLVIWSRDHKYLKRRAVSGNTRPHYVYSLASRGLRFVRERIPTDRGDDYIRECLEFQEKSLKGFQG